MFLELETDTLSEVINPGTKVMVQFSAGWCGNCRIMKPKFKRLAGEHEDITFVVIDAEKNPESRKLANVSNLPTFAAFQNGTLLDQTQTNKVEVLNELVQKLTEA
jgi:thioredoxin 1